MPGIRVASPEDIVIMEPSDVGATSWISKNIIQANPDLDVERIRRWALVLGRPGDAEILEDRAQGAWRDAVPGVKAFSSSLSYNSVLPVGDNSIWWLFGGDDHEKLAV
jgi:hypothetical protein